MSVTPSPRLAAELAKVQSIEVINQARAFNQLRIVGQKPGDSFQNVGEKVIGVMPRPGNKHQRQSQMLLASSLADFPNGRLTETLKWSAAAGTVLLRRH
jgi:hypothetical protein